MQAKKTKGYLSIAFGHFISILLVSSCARQHTTAWFAKLDGSQTGIHFTNSIIEDDSSSSFIDEFGYMGGGVGIGDFNNDGLKDIVFTGNQTSCRLYLNKGNNQFEDITLAAGLSTHVWATGVSIVDINNDGYDDIYICVFGKDLRQRAPNLLFINQHNNTFKEEAAAYGLADTGYSTQAVFLDYDHDGDLDMYLSNYLLNGPNANTVYPKDLSGHSPANDRLYRNEGSSKETGHPFFTDISMQAGIRDCGYGLGVVASDLNNDGWLDIYVADDFVSDDLLWLNNRNGTFTDKLRSAMHHTSYSSMGVDAADINNDGLADIVTLDMLPEYNTRRKLAFSFMNYERYELERSLDYAPQFMRNMLQLNNGSYLSGDTAIPYFSEIGRYAGISATDWSWSVLLADFNNDGWKDMHITNGIGRDFINADFLEFSGATFSAALDKKEQQHRIREKLASLNHISLSNYLYLNNGDLSFTDASAASGIDEPSMSNGAAYADLDNDGDLDLVINNINQEAFVFINNTIQKGISPSHHFLSIDLQGDSLNRHAFGAAVRVYAAGLAQMQEESPVRGYFSSVDQRLLFGLGEADVVDSIVITWPAGSRQILRHFSADTLLTFRSSDRTSQPRPGIPLAQSASPIHPGTSHPGLPVPAALTRIISAPRISSAASPDSFLFRDITNASGISYRHLDVPFNDYTIQRLLPQKFSQQGPAIATADIDGDGRMDLFVGGGFNASGRIFTQDSHGRFAGRNLSDSVKMQEDGGVAFLDADGDGDPDLLIACADTRYPEGSPWYVPRLYLNDGKGNFTLSPYAIPGDVSSISSCVTVADYDGDGQPDIFIGGRVSLVYPTAPRSYLLHNNKGVFSDATAKVCPALLHPGMVTAAAWADLDGDHRPDLLIAGEWMPIRLFINDHGRLRESTPMPGQDHMQGMWRCLSIADIDGDGDLDFVAGNLGLNCDYRTDSAHPMQLLAKDLDGNGSIDPIPFYYLKDEDGIRRPHPAINRAQFARQVPAIKKRFLYNRDYAHAGTEDIFKGWSQQNMLRLSCEETRSCWFENLGHGRFIRHPLPPAAQLAPVNAIVCADLDGDGSMDLLLAGNEYQTEVMMGRYDASYGCFLRGKHSPGKTPAFIPAPHAILLQGDIRSLALIRGITDIPLIFAGVNNDSLRLFTNAAP